MKSLILGGTRSGKSKLAESLAMKTKLPVTVIATATALDDEMQERIALHRQSRPGHWQTLEEPIALAQTLKSHAVHDRCIIVDCLNLWLGNLLCNNNRQSVDKLYFGINDIKIVLKNVKLVIRLY